MLNFEQFSRLIRHTEYLASAQYVNSVDSGHRLTHTRQPDGRANGTQLEANGDLIERLRLELLRPHKLSGAGGCTGGGGKVGIGKIQRTRETNSEFTHEGNALNQNEGHKPSLVIQRAIECDKLLLAAFACVSGLCYSKQVVSTGDCLSIPASNDASSDWVGERGGTSITSQQSSSCSYLNTTNTSICDVAHATTAPSHQTSQQQGSVAAIRALWNSKGEDMKIIYEHYAKDEAKASSSSNSGTSLLCFTALLDLLRDFSLYPKYCDRAVIERVFRGALSLTFSPH